VKTFRSLVVLKRPQDELWRVMRDHLVDFAANLSDIETVTQLDRTEDTPGVVRIVNEWRIRQQIPAALRNSLKISELSWVDRNTWDSEARVCAWTIEPQFLTGYIACSGQTTFADAMGGKGTRVTFEGSLDLRPGVLGALGKLEGLLSGFLESVISTIIPRNLRSVVEAAAAFQPDTPRPQSGRGRDAEHRG
jgi:hypothetical protein